VVGSVRQVMAPEPVGDVGAVGARGVFERFSAAAI
jgi:hypothetical protein